MSAPVWQLYFRGLYWVGQIVIKAANEGDSAAMDALVRSVAASVVKNPDPGTTQYGWDEGTNLRRQQALNCLYRATGGDVRIVPAMEATAKANMDTSRYYGLPRFPPHNHGVMANLALLDAGTLLSRTLWRGTAVTRLVRDSGGAWTPGWISIEQSSTYSKMNAAMWLAVADVLAAYSDASVSSAAPRIRSQARAATAAVAYLTDPSGLLVAYGDGSPTTGNTAHQPSGGLRDDVAGVISGRWSWTRPDTTFYLVRYGGSRRMHGHEDRGSLVWSTLGVSVLVDPAVFSYDPGIYTTFSRATIGHSVQILQKSPFNPRAAVVVTGRTSSGPVHGVSLRDAQYGLTHTRSWRIDAARHEVTLTDTVGAPALTTLHLDASWTKGNVSTDRKMIAFSHPSGRRLVVRGSSALTVVMGSTRPVLGWVFPKYGSRVWASQILMSAPAGRSTITLTVFTP